MGDAAAPERAAELRILGLLKEPDEPIVNVLRAFEEYRQEALQSILASYGQGTDRKEERLWYVHTLGKGFFHKALQSLRKAAVQAPVAVRHLVKLYLQWIKQSQRFYREYIRRLRDEFGGIPELEAVAQRVNLDGGADGTSQSSAGSQGFRENVLQSCHRTLIYLGDLSRYRASDQLDAKPDYGPAIGYYGLACSLNPSNGMGHHQQAVVALEQKNHLRAIYHLFRAVVVAEPHPNALNNLKLEFDKTNIAWERGELIHKGLPGDPDAHQRVLVGWFVRLHSTCFQGEPFRGYRELEREVLSQLELQLKQRSFDLLLMRMVMVNLAAQFHAGEKFQAEPSSTHQTVFLHYLRFNVCTLRVLLTMLQDELRDIDILKDADEEDVALSQLLPEIMRRILPALRLYSSWLLVSVRLIEGLAEDDLLQEPVNDLWVTYAKIIDLLATKFPIWELESLPVVRYMLQEDADTLGFKPIFDDETMKIWYDKDAAAVKPRFFDAGIDPLSEELEMMARIKDLLADGLSLANDHDGVPIDIEGTRIFHRDAPRPAPALVESETQVQPHSNVSDKAGVRKGPPNTYAAAAAAAAATGQPTSGMALSQPPPRHEGSVASTRTTRSRHDQLSRMVDDLVEDDAHPETRTGTPLQVSMASLHAQAQVNRSPMTPHTPPGLRTSQHGNPATSLQASHRRNQHSSSMMDMAPMRAASTSPHFPPGLPAGTLTPHMPSTSHFTYGAAPNERAFVPTSPLAGSPGLWSTPAGGAAAQASSRALQNAIAVQPQRQGLLFGAGNGSVWSSTAPRRTYNGYENGVNGFAQDQG